MAGSGGGGGNRAPSRESLQSAADEIAKSFSPKLDQLLKSNLLKINSRDSEEIDARRQELAEALGDEFESIALTYAGSVSKNTYIEGLSDVDMILNLAGLQDRSLSPEEIKRAISQKIAEKVSDVKVGTGNVAITLTYGDGLELQIIPAIKDSAGLRVPSWDGQQWSKIDPDSFQRALSRRNEQTGMQLIPTIKLAKAVLAGSPIGSSISGYHVEAMAIDIFRGYNGNRQYSSMLPHFFEKASKVVLSPIKDTSGQSVNVDSYLGPKNSGDRKEMSHILESISRRMTAASGRGSISSWSDFFRKLND